MQTLGLRLELQLKSSPQPRFQCRGGWDDKSDVVKNWEVQLLNLGKSLEGNLGRGEGSQSPHKLRKVGERRYGGWFLEQETSHFSLSGKCLEPCSWEFPLWLSGNEPT